MRTLLLNKIGMTIAVNRYIFGGKAEYLTKGSILVENQEVTYLVYESRSDLLTLQIGFGLNF